MLVELTLYMHLVISVMLQWIAMGNDFLNYYLDDQYFEQLHELGTKEREAE